MLIFVIQGIFEVQERLLQARDGLGLRYNRNDIELQAFSNDAIALLIEIDKPYYKYKRSKSGHFNMQSNRNAKCF